MLRLVHANDLPAARRDPVDAATLATASEIVSSVRDGGEAALRGWAERFGERAPGDPLILGPDALRAAWEALPGDQKALLRRVAGRIEAFARAQRGALADLDVAVPGGRAGHAWIPVERAGCYAPGGRFPLPSTVLMTAIPARVAGVEGVVVASPRPAPVTLAAAHVAGADAVFAVGGAQAVAALAWGVGVPAVDVIVGPGNRFVTAAKQLVAGRVGIDMLAGPSELVVIADGGADPARVAADLIAQAEHDPDALPILIALDPGLPARVRAALEAQLADLSTAAIARQALDGGFAVVCRDLGEAMALSDRLAPEHLELMVADPGSLRPRHAGAVFVGTGAAEVFGDYGAGPNHVLPTGSGARFTGGLSVADFLRLRTWLRIDDEAAARTLVDDSAALARLEGLEGHARSAESRRS
jgi:histidinol dehydrogenase